VCARGVAMLCARESFVVPALHSPQFLLNNKEGHHKCCRDNHTRQSSHTFHAPFRASPSLPRASIAHSAPRATEDCGAAARVSVSLKAQQAASTNTPHAPPSRLCNGLVGGLVPSVRLLYKRALPSSSIHPVHVCCTHTFFLLATPSQPHTQLELDSAATCTVPPHSHAPFPCPSARYHRLIASSNGPRLCGQRNLILIRRLRSSSSPPLSLGSVWLVPDETVTEQRE
jgi:hypothetical protein